MSKLNIEGALLAKKMGGNRLEHNSKWQFSEICCLGHKIMYFNTSNLFTLFKTLKAEGPPLECIAKLEKQDLCILSLYSGI
ncbi:MULTISPECIES: hypothetical protein [Flagellimonas]|uniref:hypothetical protein n=1 Tax=Flagellimonas TaxID=444459 RepID=UPI00296E8B21|nr:hypothetical protein [Muricauda sp. DH64]